jgi:hypothetical protein
MYDARRGTRCDGWIDVRAKALDALLARTVNAVFDDQALDTAKGDRVAAQ